jgi:hypothetical protein
LQLDRSHAARRAVLCAIALSAVLTPAAPWAARTVLPGGCGPTPAWIAAATLPAESQSPEPSCFSGSSNQAEAVLTVANNRPYAQLITVSGATVELMKSSFAHPLEAAFSTLLAQSSRGGAPSAFVLGPEQTARLTIDRPAPGGAQEVHIDPAPDNAFAVASVAWTLLSTASERRLLSAATESCVASAVYRAVPGPPRPEQALRRVHACVDAAGLPERAEGLLRALAGRLLRDRLFRRVIHRQGTEPDPARIAFTIAASNPGVIDPDIHLGPASFGTVQGGRTTVEHLSATGGTPPYRFYIVTEPGGAGAPSWLHLAADGTLALEPPPNAGAVTLDVEVVDSTGAHSVTPY